MCLWRKPRSNNRPASSSPTTPTGNTLTPRSARLLTAFAPPPGVTVRSRCRRISTGASRDTREISPKTNSSATRSPTTVIVTFGNDSTIFCSRAVSLKCLLMWDDKIFSRRALAAFNDVQKGIHSVRCIYQFHAHWNDRQRLQFGQMGTEIDAILFRGDVSASFAGAAQFQQLLDIALGIGAMI